MHQDKGLATRQGIWHVWNGASTQSETRKRRAISSVTLKLVARAERTPDGSCIAFPCECIQTLSRYLLAALCPLCRLLPVE
eukprot:1824024-Pyramimonas_sp.AAC.1